MTALGKTFRQIVLQARRSGPSEIECETDLPYGKNQARPGVWKLPTWPTQPSRSGDDHLPNLPFPGLSWFGG
jgi:hypothetical protein